MDETSRKVQAAYDEIAGEYARRNRGPMPEDLRRMAGLLLERMPPCGRLLDLGCGPGRDLAWFAEHGRNAIGVDLSTGMLAQARQDTACPLAQMDMRRLGFPAAIFDAIWCCASLLHLPKAQAPVTLAEMHRMLSPGGLLVIEVQQGSEEKWEDFFGERFFARYQMDEMKALLAHSGFITVESFSNQAEVRTWLSLLCLRG